MFVLPSLAYVEGTREGCLLQHSTCAKGSATSASAPKFSVMLDKKTDLHVDEIYKES
jgi:hypothetical protein